MVPEKDVSTRRVTSPLPPANTPTYALGGPPSTSHDCGTWNVMFPTRITFGKVVVVALATGGAAVELGTAGATEGAAALVIATEVVVTPEAVLGWLFEHATPKNTQLTTANPAKVLP